MARNKALQQNIDGSDLANYPNKRIRNNDGSGNGTPVDESVYGDIHELVAKVMRDSKTAYNGLPDNVGNGYQLYDAFMSVAGKNDLIKDLTKQSDDTLNLPIKIDVLKEDETLQLKATIASTNDMKYIRGTDNIQRNLVVLGSFTIGQTVKLLYKANTVFLVGLYDTQNLPNVIQRLTDIETTFVAYQKKMAVFQAGGGMIFWNKPKALIPAGWAEVVDWRGRIPAGLDESDVDFQTMGKIGGSKTKTILINNMPKHSHDFGTGVEKVGTGNTNGLSKNNGGEFNKQTSEVGGDVPMNILNPYRVVLFIEYVD